MAVARMEGVDDADTTADDITVLRSNSGGGSGQDAVTPRVLKQRFVLEEKLGSGGMGTVYRARDLRKVEARDRHPYVAVKVLNADFRNHPDAFIALQREASKSQGIAHPNIVSIFDFDKDGDIPYMTMELLEGRELTRLLRDYPNGIPDDIAWPVIEGLCAGLTRAHDAGITHSDFKPGNVYVSGSHDPKIFDFGIARAVRLNTKAGDDTVFDPSKLAALTPAYASKEMLLGEAPVPADDIYSFAVVAYLIFGGRHPYDRVRADDAERQGLVPQRIRRLSRRQWRMLNRCLAFDRAERPASMAEVRRGLIDGPRLGPVGIAALAAAAVVATTAVWFVATRSERETVARDAVVDAQATHVQALLAEPGFDAEWTLKLSETMRQLAAAPGGQTEVARMNDDVRAAYAARLDGEQDFAEQVRLLAGAETVLGAPFDAARQKVIERAAADLEALIAEARRDAEWLKAVEALLDTVNGAFPNAADRLETRAVAAYLNAIEAPLIARSGTQAKAGSAASLAMVDALVAAASGRLPSVGPPEPAAERLHSLEKRLAEIRSREARLLANSELERELSKLERTSCQRLDPGAIDRASERLMKTHPREASRIEARTVAMVAACVAAIGEVDQDRAMTVKHQAIAAFGDVPALSAVSLDPCAMRYLVGRGTDPGRSGFCADVLKSGAPGPKLVVVPARQDGARYAITKYEISWRELEPFCAATSACASTLDDLPAQGVGAQVAVDFADWLSLETGRKYHLPTIEQWRDAATDDTPDPNRNCRVALTGVDRGGALWPATSGQPNKLGVVNALGNVQEWVTDGDQLKVAGGAYVDPLTDCTAGFVRAHDGTVDALTGIRLVRDIP